MTLAEHSRENTARGEECVKNFRWKLKGNKQLERPRRRWEDNELDFKKIR
jgi:hypothetical protein